MQCKHTIVWTLLLQECDSISKPVGFDWLWNCLVNKQGNKFLSLVSLPENFGAGGKMLASQAIRIVIAHCYAQPSSR